MRQIIIFLAFIISANVCAEKRILTFDIFDEINNTTWLYTQNAFRQAKVDSADCIILHLNTYGGEVVYADSIRTQILNSPIPVYVFIDNNAASAGALISIACDSIYMRPGGNIGAATVVSGTSGEKMPDKYQSYMRSTMRSTAEAHGKIKTICNGDTIERWHRNPTIAEAMVDESVVVDGIVDSTKILTFTVEEAIANGYCEGKAESIHDVAHKVAGSDYYISEYKPTTFDNFKGFLGSSALRGILILIIIGGIYFELQTPGLGFPSIAAVCAALLYFAPLYIDGLAANWEIILFLIGVGLLAVEIFIIPGFGVAGIAGILCIICGLAFSTLDNDWFDFSNVPTAEISKSFLIVGITLIGGIVLCFIAGNYMFSKKNIVSKTIMLETSQPIENGYIGTDMTAMDYIGSKAITFTDLRPSGKVMINDELFDAITEGEFIEKDNEVIVKSMSGAQVVVTKA